MLGVGRAKEAADDCGSVLVETSIAYMLGITMLLGIIELSSMCYTFGVVSEAARAGVRYASVHGSDSSSCSGPSSGCSDQTGANVASQVTAFVETYTTCASSMNVNVSYPDGASTSPSRVQVAVSYTYKPLFGVSVTGHVFQVSTQGRIVY
jgi:Flp pilus assembly protein TadG